MYKTLHILKHHPYMKIGAGTIMGWDALLLHAQKKKKKENPIMIL